MPDKAGHAVPDKAGQQTSGSRRENMSKSLELFSFELVENGILLYFLGMPLMPCKDWFEVEEEQKKILEVFRK